SLEALRAITQRCRDGACPEVHLLNVQHSLSGHVAAFLGREDAAAWQQEQGEKALARAAAMLARLGIAHARHVRVGPRACAIAQAASELGCNRIVMATARRNSLTRLVDDSVTEQVLQHAEVPMEVVPTPHRSPLEAFGYAASFMLALGLAAMLAA